MSGLAAFVSSVSLAEKDGWKILHSHPLFNTMNTFYPTSYFGANFFVDIFEIKKRPVGRDDYTHCITS
jgi:hypothetical protein